VVLRYFFHISNRLNVIHATTTAAHYSLSVREEKDKNKTVKQKGKPKAAI